MAPSGPVATIASREDSLLLLKGVNGVHAISNGTANKNRNLDVLEDYQGNYKFAPIEEAEVSRAMIKRSVTHSHYRQLELTAST